MIAVDTSALMAILLDEPGADRCSNALATADRLLMSAGTLAEALIVGERRGLHKQMTALIEGLGFEIMPLTPAAAGRVAAAYGKWGKGVDHAALNFGDYFAYEVAKEHACPLLYVGDDFAKTDLAGVD